jgi:hypothetical protein
LRNFTKRKIIRLAKRGRRVLLQVQNNMPQPIVVSVPISVDAGPSNVHVEPPIVQPKNVQRWRDNILVYSRRPRQGVQQEQPVKGATGAGGTTNARGATGG